MRILTQNLWCHTPWDKKISHFRELARQTAPDILCIQELSTSTRSTNGTLITEAIEIENITQMNGFYSASLQCTPNQGIFTKDSIITVKDKFMFSFRGILKDGTIDKHRRFLIAELLEFDGKELLVINLHLSTNRKFRSANWEETLLWLKTSNLFESNIIIVGDLNSYEQPDIENEIIRSGFKDAWTELRTDRCITYKSSQYWLTEHPDSPVAEGLHRKRNSFSDNCLDYIFYKGNVILNRIEYVNSIPFLSDHQGLVFDFNVE